MRWLVTLQPQESRWILVLCSFSYREKWSLGLMCIGDMGIAVSKDSSQVQGNSKVSCVSVDSMYRKQWPQFLLGDAPWDCFPIENSNRLLWLLTQWIIYIINVFSVSLLVSHLIPDFPYPCVCLSVFPPLLQYRFPGFNYHMGLSTFLFFNFIQNASPLDGESIIRVGLLTSVNLISMIPQWPAQGLVS